MDNVFFNNKHTNNVCDALSAGATSTTAQPTAEGTATAAAAACAPISSPQQPATTDLWPHADQNFHIAPSGQWDCYQGVMYLWPANENTSATVIWPGSHCREYDELMRDPKQWEKKGHFCRLPRGRFNAFVAGCGRVPVARGGLLLWSSRTIHQGWPNGPRLAMPVCFEPRERRARQAYLNKHRCIESGVPTSHWASLGISHSTHSSHVPDMVDGIVLQRAAHQHLQDETSPLRQKAWALV